MTQTERIEIKASKEFVSRLNSLSEAMGVSLSEVIRSAMDALDVFNKAEQDGKDIPFVPKK